jgi:hypothetical protein
MIDSLQQKVKTLETENENLNQSFRFLKKTQKTL